MEGSVVPERRGRKGLQEERYSFITPGSRTAHQMSFAGEPGEFAGALHRPFGTSPCNGIGLRSFSQMPGPARKLILRYWNCSSTEVVLVVRMGV